MSSRIMRRQRFWRVIHWRVLRLPSESAQLVITSPPYNIGKEYETQVELEHY